MDRSSKELVRVMQAVSDVVEENTAATEEVVANTNEILRKIETIAHVGKRVVVESGDADLTVRM